MDKEDCWEYINPVAVCSCEILSLGEKGLDLYMVFSNKRTVTTEKKMITTEMARLRK